MSEDHAFQVLIDDNFHYQDEEAREKGPSYATLDEAVAECRRIVEESLTLLHKEGMSADALYSAYTSFGEDPFVVPTGDAARFSAWDYARARCTAICGGGDGTGESPPATPG